MAKIVKTMTKANWDYVGLKRFPQDDFNDDGNNFKMYIYKDFLEVSYITGEGQKYLSIREDYSNYNHTDFNFWKESFPDAASRGWEFNGVEEIDLDKLKENLGVIYQALQEAPAKYAEYCKEHENEWWKDTLDRATTAYLNNVKAIEGLKKLSLLDVDFKATNDKAWADGKKYLSCNDMNSLKRYYEDTKKDLANAEKVLHKVEKNFEAEDRKAYFTSYHAEQIAEFLKYVA